MAERERYNPATGQYETAYDDGIYENPNQTPPAYGQEPVPGVTPPPIHYDDPTKNYNGGSPPAISLKPGHGWYWNGQQWVQTPGGGLGYPAAPATTTPPTTEERRGPRGGAPAPTGAAAPTAAPLAGVPTAWSVGQSTLQSGSVPTLASAIQDAKQLGSAPAVNPYAAFTAPTPVGLEGRNTLINSILNRPQVMDQQFQDQLFEQQKETQRALAEQAKQRAAQAGASRGMSGVGGYQAAMDSGIERNFMDTLLAGRRDIATQAAQANRAAEHAAIEMQDAVSQGDFARAQAAYQTQLQAANLYDEMRFKAAEFDRANVALAAQTGMAGRQQALAEQTSSFQQFLEQLKFEELMRQFNEQIGLDYGKFGWQQQNDIMNRFPR